MIPVPPSDCTRAREAFSAHLDGELSELEEARLDLHLGRCAGCRIYTGRLEAIVLELRRAPLSRPAATPRHPPAPAPARRPRRRLPTLRVPALAAAAIALAAVTGSFALGRILAAGGPSSSALQYRWTPPASSDRADLLEQHLLAMLPATGPDSLRLGPNVLAV